MHFGNDVMGAPAQHNGDREDCPAPECQDTTDGSVCDGDGDTCIHCGARL